MVKIRDLVESFYRDFGYYDFSIAASNRYAEDDFDGDEAAGFVSGAIDVLSQFFDVIAQKYDLDGEDLYELSTQAKSKKILKTDWSNLATDLEDLENNVSYGQISIGCAGELQDAVEELQRFVAEVEEID